MSERECFLIFKARRLVFFFLILLGFLLLTLLSFLAGFRSALFQSLLGLQQSSLVGCDPLNVVIIELKDFVIHHLLHLFFKLLRVK